MAEKKFDYAEHQKRMRERLQPKVPTVRGVDTLRRLMEKARGLRGTR